MDKQIFLELLCDELEKRYKKSEKVIDKYVQWGKPEWLTLVAMIDRFVKDNPTQVKKHAKKLKERISKSKDDYPISEATFERIFKSVRKYHWLPYKEFKVERPQGDKKVTLDVICIYLGYEGWQDFVYKKFHAEEIQRIIIKDCVQKGNSALLKLAMEFPEPNTTEFNKYFIKNGTLGAIVTHALQITKERKAEPRQRLIQPEYEISSVKIEEMSENKAIVSTIENWSNRPITSNIRRKADCLPTYYIYILYSNGTEWKIEGKYLSHFPYEEIKKRYYKSSNPLLNLFTGQSRYDPIFIGNNFYEPEAWHNLLFSDYILPH